MEATRLELKFTDPGSTHGSSSILNLYGNLYGARVGCSGVGCFRFRSFAPVEGPNSQLRGRPPV